VSQAVTLKTSLGDIKLELHCDATPKACEVRARARARTRDERATDATRRQNFLALCASGYYDGTMFHRNIKGFIVQGGDPTNTGRGGESIWKAPFGDEIQPHLAHTKRGIVSMANSGPGTNGSQFFITYAKQPQLNNVYTVFGQVIDGFETLDLMERVPCDEQDKPNNPILIESVEVHANPIAEQQHGQ